MNKLNLHTVNKAEDNFKKLTELFPNAVTETIVDGVVTRAIDKEVLMQEISAHVVEGSEERYQFTWPDKKKSVLLANAPNYKTLRPCPDESVNFDTTENLYIEGDNLDVLKLLQETYLGKVKMIYIDPPYNTGKDFVYADDFKQSVDEYMDLTEQYDEEGNRLFTNSETNGRYHTDWLNMIYPRLRLAKDLLKDDGVIFISIDDNEVENLKKVCNEIFGAWNFVADFIWNSRKSVSNDAIVSMNHNYTLVFTKNIVAFNNAKSDFKLPDTGDGFNNPDNDMRGLWKADPFDSPGVRPNLTYPIVNPNTGETFFPPDGRCWRTGEKEYLQFMSEGRIVFGKTGNGKPQLKRYLEDAKEKGLTPKSLWDDCGTATDGTREIQALFGGKLFDTPKPTGLIIKILQLSTSKNDLILDFFSGSATTAHAVMQLNAEDNARQAGTGNRKFIMVQLPEEIDEKHEAYKAGYLTICDIGKERIRRAGEKIKDEKGFEAQNLDTGFRVLKCDSTNMKDVYYYPTEVEQTQIDMFTSNIKEDRSPEDLLFQVMLDLGVFLSCKIEKETVDGKNIFVVYQGDVVYLIACFDNKVSSEVVTAIAKRKPYYAVFRDSSMESDSLMTSFEQIFEAYSKDTVRKVL